MHSSPLRTAAALAVAGCALLASAGLSAFSPPSQVPDSRATAANELDNFMERVLARREVTRRMLEDYILDERERFEILGPGRTPLHRTSRDYTWYVRDGMHVRSPLRFNGVRVGEEGRQRYEADWIRRERQRRERKAADRNDGRDVTVGSGGVQVSRAAVPTEPRFVSEAYFLEFTFEPGNYYLAGRERLDGHDVLRIEYYPTRMFGDSDRDAGNDESTNRDRRRRREERAGLDREQDIEQKMNKTALVTLWIDPAEHQIVRYTFDNVWLDFLPGAWLVRMDEIRASMTMGQPFPGVWLPREMNIRAGVTLANGSFEAGYERLFSQYRLAEVETKIGVPRSPGSPEARAPEVRVPEVRLSDPGSPALRVAGPADADPVAREAGPFAGDPSGQLVEVVTDVRVHGNAFLSDQEVLDIADVAVGQPLEEDGVEIITRRLKDSRRFDSIDVRKRYRSLTSTADVTLVLVVHERAGVRSAAATAEPGARAPARPLGRLRAKLMFLPVVSFADGYGLTYGGRVSTADLLGIDERLSVPLTWGGTRRAALELERLFRTGPLTRLESRVAVWSREHPRFAIREHRVEVSGRIERVFADVLRAGADASRSTVSFGDVEDRLWTVGTSVALDTRLDPGFPGNAVFLGAGWTGLHFTSTPSLPGRVNRYTADGRGYLRAFRQIVLAGRAQYTGADAGLPPYERLLLGGSASLRGFRAGAFEGDRTLVTSAELRVPITSVLSGARFGVTAFIDAAKVWEYGQSVGGADWHRGAGAGVFLIASVVKINVDVARGLTTGATRVHFSSGFAF